MTTPPSEWITVAEAARRLGLSDRHARRLADRLSDQDRIKQGTSPLRVRLAALAHLWERETQLDTPTDSAADSAVEDSVSRARLEERLDAAEVLIVELRDDKQRLQDTLLHEQENHRRLLDQLSDERRDLRLMHARPLPALPQTPEPEPADDNPDPPPPMPPAAPLPIAEPAPPTLLQRLAQWLSD